jgi:DNA polymerase III delta prime subunit
MEEVLIGQENAYAILNSIVGEPPHIFLTGAFGFGKTHMAKQFIETYAKQHGFKPDDQEWVYRLSSDKDRGIHTVREGLAEFVRHSPNKEGIYRWIFIDDADTLPIVSQQALRRPMETHAHTTRFIFCSRHVSDLIGPLRSRCLHVELETVSMQNLYDVFCKRLEYTEPLSNSIYITLMTMSLSPRQLLQYMKCIKALGSTDAVENNFKHIFTGKSDGRILDLIKYFLRKNDEKVYTLLFEIWNSGISYEDFLTDLSRCAKTIGILPPRQEQELYELIIQGWVYYTHGRTHFIDLLSLFRKTWDTSCPLTS